MDYEPGIQQIPSATVYPFRRPPVADGEEIAPAAAPSSNLGPIELTLRSKLAKLKGCKYPDTFDWSVYDRIASRYAEPPRGGVVFNTTFKLANHHSACSKCHYAFELDSYGRGCFHNCQYCYAKDQLERHGYWNRPQPFPVDLAEIRKIFYTVFETDKSSKWRTIMECRTPVRLGSMSDSFMWLDTKYGVSKELLKIFRFYRYPYLVFTRSDLIAHDDYIAELDNQLCAAQFSISGNNHAITRVLEPGAPSYKRRLAAISKLNAAGIWTTVRINPLIPKYPDGYYTDIDSINARFGNRENAPTFDMYNDEFIAELAAAGVPSVLAGFVRLPMHSIKRISDSTGVNLRSFFKPENIMQRGESRYSEAEIGAYYRDFHKSCRTSGVRFSTCYIGNGLKDFFQYQGLWSNKEKDCCDVIGNVKSFQTTSQKISWETRLTHAVDRKAAQKAQADLAVFESSDPN